MRKGVYVVIFILLVISEMKGQDKKKQLKFADGGIQTTTVINEEIFTICPHYSYKRLGSFVALQGSKVAACALDEKENDKIIGINYLDLNNGIDTVTATVKLSEADLDKIVFKEPIKVISENISLTQKYIIVQHEKKGLAIHNLQDGKLLRYIPVPTYSEKITYHINRSGDVLFIRDTDISGKFFDLTSGEILSEVIAPEGTLFTGAFKFMNDSRKYLIGFKPMPGYTKKKVKSTVIDSLNIFDHSETLRMEELFLNQTQYPKEQYKTGLVFGEATNRVNNLPRIINDSIPDFIATRHILFAKQDSLIVTIHDNGVVMSYQLKNGNYHCTKVITSLPKTKLLKGFFNQNSNSAGGSIKLSRLLRPDISVTNVLNAAISPDGKTLLLHNKAYTVITPNSRLAMEAKTGITAMHLPTGTIKGFFSCDLSMFGISMGGNTFDTEMHFTDDGTAFFSKGKAYSLSILLKLLTIQSQLDPVKTIQTRVVKPVFVTKE